MYVPNHNFSLDDIRAIHQLSLELLAETGVEFPSRPTRDFFRDHGYRVEGEKVFITQPQLEAALKTAPPAFDIRARNPERSLTLGGDRRVTAPTAGATQIADAEGRTVPATMEHYRNLARLIQTSNLNMPMAHQVCHPQELPAETAYLDMFLCDITQTDRVLTANTTSPEKVENFLRLLELIFGGRAEVERGACSINVINPCTPLKYAADQSESLILLAGANQPAAVTNMMMLGATAPLSVPGALAVGNAEILAGIVLAQLVRPGAPVVYGSTSCPMDMKTMVAILGAPETVWLSKGAQALADFYGLPCRTGGSLTDSHQPDAQAMTDGSLLFHNALTGGAHYMLHSFGMMGSYLSASFEKFVIDEEMVSLALAALKVPEVSPATLEADLIKRLGSKADYLTQGSTIKGFRRLYRSKFFNRSAYDQWLGRGRPSILEAAAAEVRRRLEAWEKPPIDPQMEKELESFITSLKR